MTAANTSKSVTKARSAQPIAPESFMIGVYEELRTLAAALMRAERRDFTLQPTAVVHEAYVRVTGIKEIQWQSTEHFFAFAATCVRRVIVDHARNRGAQKRGRDRVRVDAVDYACPSQSELAANLLDLDDALIELAGLSPEQARLVELRFFGGLSMEEAADAMEIAPRTAQKYWAAARAWLACRLDSQINVAGPVSARD
ncbi:MAG: ECF-type sigma factor [Phycisphaerae bacterium]|nr:ECF-type sigma factor [Phycisphaerae bacterium]